MLGVELEEYDFDELAEYEGFGVETFGAEYEGFGVEAFGAEYDLDAELPKLLELLEREEKELLPEE